MSLALIAYCIGVAQGVVVVFLYACIVAGARSERLDDARRERAELNRAIALGGAGTALHADFTNAKGPADHV